MILCIDAGNTNIKCGVFGGGESLPQSSRGLIGEEPRKSWRLATDKSATADQYAMLFLQLLAHAGLRAEDISGAIIASVVPTINNTLEQTLSKILTVKPLFVGPGTKTGLAIRYDDPRQLGADRIVSAVAAYNMHGGPVIVADFGTATSFGAVSAKGEFLGGCICPGLAVAADALASRAARLTAVDFDPPSRVIARNTVNGLQSGLIYGYIGQVEYLVARMRGEMGAPGCPVIATGGMAGLVAERSEAITEVDPDLTLKGLAMLFEKNG